MASNRISGTGLWGMTVDRIVIMLRDPDGSFDPVTTTTWYAKVIVTDLDGTPHDITPSRLGPGVVMTLSLDHMKSDDFSFMFEDYDGTIRAWLEKGCLVSIYVDLFTPPTTIRFYGMVEEVKETQPKPTTIMVEVTGRDKFSIHLDRKVTETYADVEVSAIVRDLMWIYAPHPDEVVLGMSFYEGTGTEANDESKYLNHGTLVNAPTWVNGKYGTALEFNGVTQYVTVPDSDDLDNIVSFEAWVNPLAEQSHVTAWHILVSKHNNFLNGLYMRYNSSPNRFAVIFEDSLGTPSVADWEIPTYNLNYHVRGVFEDNRAKLYVNGDLKDMGDVILDTDEGINAEPVRIGGGRVSRYSAAVIDEVRLQTRAPTAVEVLSQYTYPYLHDIDVTSETPDDMRFPYRSLKEVLNHLGKISSFDYQSNPNTVILWKSAASIDTGMILSKTDMAPSPSKLSSLRPLKNRVYVLGGNYMELEQYSTVIGATKNTKDFWYAQRFTPARTDMDQITLHIKRTGSPDNLEGEIRTNHIVNGPGDILATFTVDSDFIGTTASWVPITVKANFLLGYTYWIVLKKNGDGANNYEWSDDNLNTGVNAFDADGAGAWTIQAASYLMAFKTHYAVPIIAVKQDYDSKDKYIIWREHVHEDPAIVSREVSRTTAEALLDELKDETPNIRLVRTLNQLAIPDRGKLVAIDLPDFNIDMIQYVVNQVFFQFYAGQEGTWHMDVYLGRSAEELDEWLNRLKLDIDRVKVGLFGVGEGLINLIETLGPDTVTAGDALNLTVVAAGDHRIDSARVDFSDIG